MCVAKGVRRVNPFTKGVATTTTNALQDSNLHFDIMNIKFYLLSQEFAYFGEGIRGGVRCAFQQHHPQLHTFAKVIFGQNCSSTHVSPFVTCFCTLRMHMCTPSSRVHTASPSGACICIHPPGACMQHEHAYFFFFFSRRNPLGETFRSPQGV